MDLGTINLTTQKPETGLIRPLVPHAKAGAQFSAKLAIDPAQVDFDQVTVEETAKPEEKTALSDNADKSETEANTPATVANPTVAIATPLIVAPVAVQIADAALPVKTAADAGIAINAADILQITPDKATAIIANPLSAQTATNLVSVLSAAADSANPTPAADGNSIDPALQNLIATNLSAPVAQKPMAKSAVATATTATADTLTKTPAADSPLPLPSSPKDAAGDPNLDPASMRLSRQAPADGQDPAALLHAKAEAKADAPAPQTLPAGTQPIQIQVQAPVDYKNVQAAAVAQQPVAEQVAVHIVKAAKDGVDKIKIQLTPENLGRVTVHLEMDKDALVKAVIATDKPEAAEWLAKDAKQLERALQDAGIKADTSNMEFQNRNQSSAHNFANQFSDNYNSSHGAHKYYGAKHGMADVNPESNVIVKNLYVRDGGVNIMV